MSEGHVLYRVKVDIVALCNEKADTLLVSPKKHPEKYFVVHLAWNKESNPKFPYVAFEGTWEEFTKHDLNI